MQHAEAEYVAALARQLETALEHIRDGKGDPLGVIESAVADLDHLAVGAMPWQTEKHNDSDACTTTLVRVSSVHRDIVGNGVFVSEYAIRHPEEYGMRATLSIGTGLGYWRNVPELVLLDRQGDPIDEDGCNCDDGGACNNPTCVMQREKERWP